MNRAGDFSLTMFLLALLHRHAARVVMGAMRLALLERRVATGYSRRVVLPAALDVERRSSGR
jgi:hypothetical protein